MATPTTEIKIRGKTYVLNHLCGSDAVLDSLRMGLNRTSRQYHVDAMKDLANGTYGEMKVEIYGSLYDASMKAFSTPVYHGMLTLYEFAKTEQGLPYLLCVVIPDLDLDGAREAVKEFTIAERLDIAVAAVGASGVLLIPNSNGPNGTGRNQNPSPTDSDSTEP